MDIFDFIPPSTLNHFNDGSIILLDKMDGYFLVSQVKIKLNDEPWKLWSIRLNECGANGNVSEYSTPIDYSLKEFLELGPHKIKQKMPIYF